MNIGLLGLGHMGAIIAQRLLKAGLRVIAFDPNITARQQATTLGVEVVERPELVAQKTRIVWLMVPAGQLIDTLLEQLLPYLTKEHLIIDGGNSHFTDSVRRAQTLATLNIPFLDCGTSGGLHAQQYGFCLMVGGDHAAFLFAQPLFAALAAPNGYAYIGPSGAGHYVKMIHNGIEYALLQAYAEGFTLLKQGTAYPHLDLAALARVWNHGSIIRSWILELLGAVLRQDQELHQVSGAVQENGTGSWTVQEAHKQHIPVPLLEQAVQIRVWSRQTGGNYTTKLVALLRHQFGGHPVQKIKQ